MNTYGILIERTNEYGSEYVTARIVKREEGKTYPCGTRSEGESGYGNDAPKNLVGLRLDGLGMRGFVSDFGGHFLLHGYDYTNIFSLEMADLKRMTKTLARLLARAEKDAACEPGDKLVAMARAFRLSFVVERTNKTSRSSYADNDWRWMSVEEGRNRYRNMIAEAVAAHAERHPKKENVA